MHPSRRKLGERWGGSPSEGKPGQRISVDGNRKIMSTENDRFLSTENDQFLLTENDQFLLTENDSITVDRKARQYSVDKRLFTVCCNTQNERSRRRHRTRPALLTDVVIILRTDVCDFKYAHPDLGADHFQMLSHVPMILTSRAVRVAIIGAATVTMIPKMVAQKCI